MLHRKKTSVPLRSLLFHLVDINLYNRPAGWESEKLSTNQHTLYFFSSGNGRLSINQYPYQLSIDKCYMVAPGTMLHIENMVDSPLCYYQITFNAIRVGDTTHDTFTNDIISNHNGFTMHHYSRFIRLTEELHSNKNSISDMESFRQHLRFQELMGLLFEHNLYSDQSYITALSVNNTIQYLQDNYMHRISVKQLAELAEVPLWQYTPIFHKLTGKKPLDYLNELRINHSKEWLMCSDEPLRKIAHRVGFEDEFYFNRRFRQTTGITPRQYANSMRNKNRVKDWTGHLVAIPDKPARIIFHSETFGDLLALGIEAVGGGYSFIAQALLEDQIRNVEDVGCPIDVEKLIAIKPDLIIFANADENQYQKISQIAPTVTFNSFASLEQRLLTLGDWFDRKQAAEQWLNIYHTKAVAMWKQLRCEIKPGETASVFIIEHGKRLFVMGTIGLSSALYHPLGFQPVEKIQEVLDLGEEFREIPKTDLPGYAGDRIFMLLPDNPVSRKEANGLINDPIWKNLSAVKNGCAYILEANEWNHSDALIREKVLDMLPNLLIKNKRAQL
ncbi:ABC-type Fe3+-hydroxamate transport system, substrate-binding protein [Paenibacillus uliginis N3/975]|uniref:ABC-type Fe3+-hydroxamate transport system, substrate-binding protein n=1 Tax=Paenibacillus uliginis N3/975 TaxID=1313296 RepID=A0A1X7HS04_9BACL|nr:AraC family transcriptional regulator [Paenibacillus uliginis]SMF91824.1 ABC-type Fe3+-hydroxamate transport system, substrate-binding protein [Paenibacillus uliginis N3/975]